MTVQQEGNRSVERKVKYYNLDMIISLGYRIKSKIATNFRKWATERLKEYMIKGFTMDDERLKGNGGGNYWKELLARIKDIRSSEKVLYRQVLDLYATAVDYDPKDSKSIEFFKIVQNKLHYAAHGHTASEVIYERAGGVVDPLPEDAPFFVKDYYAYYKTPRGYHKRSLNSNEGWNVIGTMSFMNQPILTYTNEIRSAVLVIHGEKAHSCYMSKDAFNSMTKNSQYKDNKELMIIPGAVHTDLYDQIEIIPFDKIETFFKKNLK